MINNVVQDVMIDMRGYQMARPNKEVLEERQNFLQTITDCANSPSLFSEVFLDHDLFEYNKKSFIVTMIKRYFKGIFTIMEFPWI